MPQFFYYKMVPPYIYSGKKTWSEVLCIAFSEILKLKFFLFNFQSLLKKGSRAEEHSAWILKDLGSETNSSAY